MVKKVGVVVYLDEFKALAAEFIETKKIPLSEVSAPTFYKWVVYERVGVREDKKESANGGLL